MYQYIPNYGIKHITSQSSGREKHAAYFKRYVLKAKRLFGVNG